MKLPQATKFMQILLRLIFWHSISAVGLIGCNSLFYHPDSLHYGDPASLGFRLESRRILVDDSEEIDAVILRTTGQRKGTVVHFHGNAQNMTAHLGFTYWIPEHGFDLYIFDYRGYGKSSGRPSRKATIDDGIAVLEDAVKDSGGKPVFVLGQSLGAAVGFVSIAQLVQRGVCAFVFESGFDSYRAVVRDKLSAHWLSWPLQYPLSYLVTDHLSPRLFLNETRLPILFLHGAADAIVPVSSGRRLYEAYLGPTKKWVELPGAGHTPFFADPKSEYREMVIDFFEDQLRSCEASTQ